VRSKPAPSVLADREKFALRLGVPEKKLGEFFKYTKALVVGGGGGAAVGYFSWLAGLGVFGKILAAAGLVAGPTIVAPLAVGAALVAGGTFITGRVRKKYSRVTEIKGKKSFTSPLTELALQIADLVFSPMVRVARIDGELKDCELELIREKMLHWGYSDEFSDDFISEYTEKDLDDLIASYQALTEEASKSPLLKKDTSIKALRKRVVELCWEVAKSDDEIDISEKELISQIKQLLK